MGAVDAAEPAVDFWLMVKVALARAGLKGKEGGPP